MNTNIHGLIHKKIANNLPFIHKFYILAYILSNLHSILRRVLLTHMQRFYLLVLLNFKIQPHVNTQTNLHSLHTFMTNLYTHSDKKNHALQTGIHTSLHVILILKIILILTNTSTCIHTRIHKRYLLAFAYR